MSTTAYVNGLLYLGGGRFEPGCVVTDGERIVRVGVGADAHADADSVVDLAGGTLLPGFQDAHVHPLFAGVQLLGVDLSGVHDREAYFRAIADYAAAHPEEAVLSGGGWYGDVFEGGLPTAKELDALVPDRPVILTSHDWHGVWVNSRALDAAGIDASTPDPSDGRIVRDERGAPTGVLLEGAGAPATALIPEPDDARLREALLAAQARLHSVGITAWQDAMVGSVDGNPNALPVYEALRREDLLTARVVLSLWWDRTRGLEQIAELEAARDRFRDDPLVTASTVKVMLDGVIENRTAAMLEPFDGDTEDRGLSFIEPPDLVALTTALDAAGFQVHIHAVGDAAVRNALDAIESARALHGPSGLRHHIAHIDVLHPDDAPRFRQLDVTANVSPLWARLDEEIATRKLPLLGAERARFHFPFGTLHAEGARIAGGSDWPVTDPNPLWAIKTAVTRTGTAADPHAIGAGVFTEPLEAEQAIPYGTALDAYLSAAAFVNGLDAETGVLREGAYADLVVIDRDIRDVAALDHAKVTRTVVAGETVFEA